MIGSLQPWLASKVLFPAYHFLRRDGVLQAIDRLVKGQWETPQSLRALQEAKLASLLQHCECNVPYYRSLFAELGLGAAELTDPQAFARLPLLTKDRVRQNQLGLRAENLPAGDLIANSTSGSTGEPMRFFHDRRSSVWRQAVVWRNQEWVGALYSDREARLWGAPMDISKVESMRGRLHSAVHQKLMLSSFALSDESMRRYAVILRRFRPRVLVAYANPLATFAEFLQRSGEEVPEIGAIITSAETLYPWQRELIEPVFGRRIFDRYGCREFGNIAHQCGEHDGYHVNVERFLVEILDSQGKPVADGTTGELVVTDLDNYGFPFVRYRIGDLAVASSERCACGRGLPLIRRIEGRSFDVVECPTGQRIAGNYWSFIMRRVAGALQFQIVQDQIDHLLIKLRLGNDWVSGSEQEITRIIKEACGEAMRVDFEFVDRIDLTASGKSRLVINQLH